MIEMNFVCMDGKKLKKQWSNINIIKEKTVPKKMIKILWEINSIKKSGSN